MYIFLNYNGLAKIFYPPPHIHSHSSQATLGTTLREIGQVNDSYILNGFIHKQNPFFAPTFMNETQPALRAPSSFKPKPHDNMPLVLNLVEGLSGVVRIARVQMKG